MLYSSLLRVTKAQLTHLDGKADFFLRNGLSRTFGTVKGVPQRKISLSAKSISRVDSSAGEQADVMRELCGGVAHRLEQAAHNHLVVGSIPTTPTTLCLVKTIAMNDGFCLLNLC